MAKKKNVYSRQLARVLVSETQEIVSQSLYPGNTLSCSVFKEMVYKMENHLELENKAKRGAIARTTVQRLPRNGNRFFCD